MSQYDPVTPARLQQFLTRLGRAYREQGSVYLVGGTGLLYQQLKGLTKDVDLSTRLPAAARDRFGAVVRRLSREMNMAIEEVSPADFIPLPRGAEARHRYLGREGGLTLYAFDPVSTALAKIARGRAGDYEDIRALVAAGQLDGAHLTTALEEILPRVAAGEALKITPEAFRVHLAEFLASLPAQQRLPAVAPGQTAGPHAAPLDPGAALAAEFRQRAEDLRAARPQTPLDRVDAAALRDVALAHPEATAHALREALLDGSQALDAGTVADADRYADATATRALLDPAVRQARAAHQRDQGGGHGR